MLCGYGPSFRFKLRSHYAIIALLPNKFQEFILKRYGVNSPTFIVVWARPFRFLSTKDESFKKPRFNS